MGIFIVRNKFETYHYFNRPSLFELPIHNIVIVPYCCYHSHHKTHIGSHFSHLHKQDKTIHLSLITIHIVYTSIKLGHVQF